MTNVRTPLTGAHTDDNVGGVVVAANNVPGSVVVAVGVENTPGVVAWVAGSILDVVVVVAGSTSKWCAGDPTPSRRACTGEGCSSSFVASGALGCQTPCFAPVEDCSGSLGDLHDGC